MAQRKLGRTADQRKALIRNQVTNLIWYGRIETTEARAKEVRRAAERLTWALEGRAGLLWALLALTLLISLLAQIGLGG